MHYRHLLARVSACAVLAVAVSSAHAQQKFPLAAPAGVDSNARQAAPPAR